MRRSVTLFTGLLVLASLGWLTGCDTFDSNPSEVEDFDIQENMNTPTGRTVTPDLSPQFSVNYQGLAAPPTASSPSDVLAIDTVSTQGDATRGGERRWRLSLTTDNIDQVLAQASVLIEGRTTGGRTITDTLAVSATTTLQVQRDFTSSFAVVADYEGDVTASTYGGNDPATEAYEGSQRTIQTSGGTSTTLVNQSFSQSTNQPGGSNGVRYLEIEGSSSGSTTIQRWMSVSNADIFTFLVRPASSSFILTISFTEETENGPETYELDLPIPAGGGWLKIGVPFEFFEGFNPVAARAGGNGPLTSIDLSADRDVTYAIDELVFGKQGVGGRAEFHDFERTTLAYGPPFCTGNSYGFAMGTDSVSTASDGLTSRRLSGQDCFGYNYGRLYVDVDGSDVLSFRAKGSTDTAGEDVVEVFVQTGGAGGFGGTVSRVAPDGNWKTFEVPISQLGDDPSALLDPGINNIGFNADGTFLLDDVKIMPKE
ncbi:hypothetical protein [Salinibacter ruber]|jgi:hypothetical protein|nr:hypothetical protein [Salinibacter ruber]MBB4061112.1 hypothetical protein [Salinibacter ruber]MBB4070043.1 hypothetical protein [Salinibacter ruber]MCS3610183.1 hypothetical protein [Salinibacter ruber]MCS3627821.1 hypothetical protein [Salinibacter ruber]MCS3635140.1 hypothetical protein [Salinibacter ruber]